MRKSKYDKILHCILNKYNEMIHPETAGLWCIYFSGCDGYIVKHQSTGLKYYVGNKQEWESKLYDYLNANMKEDVNL